jgi:hypothetical protein
MKDPDKGGPKTSVFTPLFEFYFTLYFPNWRIPANFINVFLRYYREGLYSVHR